MLNGCYVICYRKLPSEEQIKDVLRKKNFKEAIALVEELECDGELSKDMLSFVHAQVGFLLLFDLHFEEAVNHFLQSETMQPSEIFPFIMRDPNRWSLLVYIFSNVYGCSTRTNSVVKDCFYLVPSIILTMNSLKKTKNVK